MTKELKEFLSITGDDPWFEFLITDVNEDEACKIIVDITGFRSISENGLRNIDFTHDEHISVYADESGVVNVNAHSMHGFHMMCEIFKRLYPILY